MNESTLLGLALVGLGVPAWIFSIAIYHAAKRPRKQGDPSERYFVYARVLGFIHDEMKDGHVDCGPIWAAAMRELRAYPEYADLSVLFLEEINITGTKKFDRVMEKELKETEAFLLGIRQ